jgi:hypothetical protein
MLAPSSEQKILNFVRLGKSLLDHISTSQKTGIFIAITEITSNFKYLISLTVQ